MVASIPNDIFQFSTFSALQAGFGTDKPTAGPLPASHGTQTRSGVGSGGPPAGNLTSHGTDGIGAFENGDLMVLVDSRAYALKSSDGASPMATSAALDSRLSFAMVTIFRPEHIVHFSHIDSIQHFSDLLRARRESGEGSEIRNPVQGAINSLMPFKLHATFTDMVLQTKDTYTIENTTGTIFGFIVPEWMKGISGLRIHCHFLGDCDASSHDAIMVGGRVVNFKVDSNASVEIAKCGRFHLGFPQVDEWENLKL